MDRVIKAADFAAKKHRDQRRKGPGQAPYINHPIGVANILINEGNPNQNITKPLQHLLKSPNYLKKMISKKKNYFLIQFFMMPLHGGH